MQDFKWTDELVKEFLADVLLGKRVWAKFETPDETMEQFKSSKTAKDWEVVAYRGIHGEIYTLQPDGTYRNEQARNPAPWKDYQFKEPGEYIHSIRRLSDDWTITIKDKVKSSISGRIGIIKSFDSTGHILFEDITGLDHVMTIEKLPAPVLVTTDGKEIYHDHAESLSLVYSDLGFDFNASLGHAIRENQRKENGVLIFSTREAAEAFVLENRLSLSIRSLRECIPHYISPITAQEIIDKATELIKSKNK